MASDLSVGGAGASLAASLGVSVTSTGALAVPKPLAVALGVSVTGASNLTLPLPLVVALGASVGLSANLVVQLLMRLHADLALYAALEGDVLITERLGGAVEIAEET